jgi:hypothetical protein
MFPPSDGSFCRLLRKIKATEIAIRIIKVQPIIGPKTDAKFDSANALTSGLSDGSKGGKESKQKQTNKKQMLLLNKIMIFIICSLFVIYLHILLRLLLN